MTFSMSLGNLITYIMADATQYTRTLRKTERLMNKTSTKMTAIGRKMSLSLTVPLTLIGGASVRAFGNFDDAMIQSLAIMGEVAPEMRKEMRDVAKELSGRSVKGATELARSYFFLASAGLNAAQSVAALGAVEKFAVAGAFDMALATDLLTDAQSALGKTVNDTEQNMRNMVEIGDVLVKANTLANASVQQFSTALTAKAGTAMKSYNIDLREGIAVLAAYADQGIKAELAGNTFGRMLRLLIRSINDNEDAFKKLGIQTQDAQGNLPPLADIFEDITNAVEGMGAVQKAATLELLGFQARSQQAILPLLGLSDRIRGYEKALESAGGITEEVANKQLKSFNNQLKILWNQVTLAAIAIGGTLAPWIQTLSVHVKKALDWFRGLDESTRKWIVGIGIAVAVLGPLLIILGVMASALSAVAGFLAFMGSAAIVSAAGIAVVVAAVAGLIYWIVGPTGLSDAWGRAWEAAKTFSENVIGFLGNIRENIHILLTWFSRNWLNLLKDIIQLWITYWKNGISNFQVVLNTMTRLLSAFQGWVAKLYIRLFRGDFNKALLDGLKQAAKTLWRWVKEISLWGILRRVIMGESLPERLLKNLGKNLAKGFKEGFESEDFLGTAKKILKEGMGQLKTPLEGFQTSVEGLPELKLAQATANKVVRTAKAVNATTEKIVKKAPQAAMDLGMGGMGGPTRSESDFRQVSLRRFSLAPIQATARPKKQNVYDDVVATKLEEINNTLSEQRVVVLGAGGA